VTDPNLRILSNPNARWTGSIRTAIRYRKFQVSGLLDIRHGSMVPNDVKGALWSYGTHRDTQNRATCTIVGLNEVCTGNMKVFGQGGWFDGPVVGPGANIHNFCRDRDGRTFWAGIDCVCDYINEDLIQLVTVGPHAGALCRRRKLNRSNVGIPGGKSLPGYLVPGRVAIQ